MEREKEGRGVSTEGTDNHTHTSTHLDVLDEVCSAVGNLFGCLHKVPLGHRVAGLAACNLTRIAQDTSVLGNHCSCSQHLGSEVLHLHHLHQPLGRSPSVLFPSLPSLLFTPPQPNSTLLSPPLLFTSLTPHPSPPTLLFLLLPWSLLSPPPSFPSPHLLLCG